MSKFQVPGIGIWTVFANRIKMRCPVRDTIWTLVLTLSHFALSFALEAKLTPLTEYSPPMKHLLSRLLTAEMLTIPCLFSLAAAFLGATSVPNALETEAVEGLLLTRLSSFDICAGRLVANLWNLLLSLFLSTGIWVVANSFLRFEKADSDGVFAILTGFGIQASALLLIGALSALFAIRRRSGGSWGRGAGIASLWAVFSLIGLFMLNELIKKLEDPTRLINFLLLINPATSAASALQHDILRWNGIYERTIAPEYPFSYPLAWQSLLFFTLGTLLTLVLASWRLKKSLQNER